MFPSPGMLVRAFGASFLLASCVTVRSQREVLDDVELTAARPVAVWEILSGESRRGFVVRYEESRETPRSFFSVRNAWHQELGIIDELGRSWRLLPHEEEARWLGSGTVEQGVQRILELDEEACLREVELDTAGQELGLASALNPDERTRRAATRVQVSEPFFQSGKRALPATGNDGLDWLNPD